METSTFKSTFKRLLLIQPQAIVRHPKKPLKRPSSVLVDESEIKQIPKAYWNIFCAPTYLLAYHKKACTPEFGANAYSFLHLNHIGRDGCSTKKYYAVHEIITR